MSEEFWNGSPGLVHEKHIFFLWIRHPGVWELGVMNSNMKTCQWKCLLTSPLPSPHHLPPRGVGRIIRGAPSSPPAGFWGIPELRAPPDPLTRGGPSPRTVMVSSFARAFPWILSLEHESAHALTSGLPSRWLRPSGSSSTGVPGLAPRTLMRTSAAPPPCLPKCCWLREGRWEGSRPFPLRLQWRRPVLCVPTHPGNPRDCVVMFLHLLATQQYLYIYHSILSIYTHVDIISTCIFSSTSIIYIYSYIIYIYLHTCVYTICMYIHINF